MKKLLFIYALSAFSMQVNAAADMDIDAPEDLQSVFPSLQSAQIALTNKGSTPIRLSYAYNTDIFHKNLAPGDQMEVAQKHFGKYISQIIIAEPQVAPTQTGGLRPSAAYLFKSAAPETVGPITVINKMPNSVMISSRYNPEGTDHGIVGIALSRTLLPGSSAAVHIHSLGEKQTSSVRKKLTSIDIQPITE